MQDAQRKLHVSFLNVDEPSGESTPGNKTTNNKSSSLFNCSQFYLDGGNILGLDWCLHFNIANPVMGLCHYNNSISYLVILPWYVFLNIMYSCVYIF